MGRRFKIFFKGVKVKIITLSGLARHGKDSSASILTHYFESREKKCLTIHYADYLKYIATEYYSWDGVKDSRARTLLQSLGTDIARKRNPNIWLNVVVEFLKTFGDDYNYIFIPDCRFENEVLGLKKAGFNVFSVWVHRNDFDNGLTEEQKNHPSETSLLDFEFDWTISVESKIYKLKDTLENMVKVNNL